MSSETPNVRAIVQYFHEIQAEPIRWLWKNRIAKGKLTLVVLASGLVWVVILSLHIIGKKTN